VLLIGSIEQSMPRPSVHVRKLGCKDFSVKYQKQCLLGQVSICSEMSNGVESFVDGLQDWHSVD
jgi:hypothetical protein